MLYFKKLLPHIPEANELIVVIFCPLRWPALDSEYHLLQSGCVVAVQAERFAVSQMVLMVVRQAFQNNPICNDLLGTGKLFERNVKNIDWLLSLWIVIYKNINSDITSMG